MESILNEQHYSNAQNFENGESANEQSQEKNGIVKLGLILNLKKNAKGENCFTQLSKILGETHSAWEINKFIESSNFKIEYIDEEGDCIDQDKAFVFRFKLPWKDARSQDVFGYFYRKDLNTSFKGVKWGPKEFNHFHKYGNVNAGSWKKLKELSNTHYVSQLSIGELMASKVEFYNGAMRKQFPDGTEVVAENGKFAKFDTKLKMPDGKAIVGWFTKNIRGKYEGISWGTEEVFLRARKQRENLVGNFFVGRMLFDSIGACNDFLEELKGKIIPEEWSFKNNKDEKYNYPILKSYLEHELDRLFYEKDKYHRTDTILYNKDKNMILFNTNLINVYGDDLVIAGKINEIGGKEYIGNLCISPAKKTLKDWGFDTKTTAKPPKFFQNINEIVFHCDWEIDTQDMTKYDHIILERIDRFPEEYKTRKTDELGQILKDSINFASRIAQRNYKFIIPMYYPTKKRIQLLMPIYLKRSYTEHPDFALVLTPREEDELYELETILGLNEVYQDARLIAKPEESWLKPEIIE